MRNFLTDKVIVGAMMVSRNPEILDISIPNMMKWCDWALILMDNESKEVEDKVLKYQQKYFNKMFVRRSSIPSQCIDYKGREISYRRRCKAVKGIIRDDVFINLRRILDWKKPGFEKIDILLWPDSDEIFTDSLSELLEGFIASDKKALMTKPVDVVGDMQTVKQDSMAHHVHILKYSRDLSAYPWRYFAIYHPLVPNDLQKVSYYSIHLAYLTESIRKWREDNWKKDQSMTSDLWKTDKSVEHMTPEEINNIFKREPDEKLS